jgi:uncharacterized protein YkwD
VPWPLRPVIDSSRLASAAQAHVNYLVSQGLLSHTGRNGSTVGSRAHAAGCYWSVIAENVARG